MAIKKKEKHWAQTRPAPFCQCLLCGETMKVTIWRKHLAIKHSMQGLPRFQDYFDNEPKQQCRCKICSKLIPKKNWSEHLLKKHHIGKKIVFSDYFKINNHSSYKKLSQSLKPSKDWYCGDILNGPPKISIIFNALCTNRRKH